MPFGLVGVTRRLARMVLTLLFIKRLWFLLEKDIMEAVHEDPTSIQMRCNSSFITLIPKLDSPIIVTDYRPISLIGMQYKIIAKVLANRLAKVVDSVVNSEQSAFIKGHQILDGLIMLNEIIDCIKRKRNN